MLLTVCPVPMKMPIILFQLVIFISNNKDKPLFIPILFLDF